MIRTFAEGDLDALLDTWYRASLIAHPFLTEDFLAQERKNIPELYMPHAETWVFDLDGDIVGFISLIENEVAAIFVEPDLQGRGIGRSLMDYVRALRGELEVDVFEANSIGRRFYDRYGFLPMREYMHEPTGQRVLRLHLPQA